jgi:hypothetical protein
MREEQYELPQLHRSTRRNQFVQSVKEKRSGLPRRH